MRLSAVHRHSIVEQPSALPSSAAADEIILHGWLRKKDRFGSAFKPRFWVLRPSGLAFSHTKTCEVVDKVIAISEVHEVCSAFDARLSNVDVELYVQTRGRKYVLHAPTYEEAKKWVAAIEQAVAVAAAANHSPATTLGATDDVVVTATAGDASTMSNGDGRDVAASVDMAAVGWKAHVRTPEEVAHGVLEAVNARFRAARRDTSARRSEAAALARALGRVRIRALDEESYASGH